MYVSLAMNGAVWVLSLFVACFAMFARPFSGITRCMHRLHSLTAICKASMCFALAFVPAVATFAAAACAAQADASAYNLIAPSDVLPHTTGAVSADIWHAATVC